MRFPSHSSRLAKTTRLCLPTSHHALSRPFQTATVHARQSKGKSKSKRSGGTSYDHHEPRSHSYEPPRGVRTTYGAFQKLMMSRLDDYFQMNSYDAKKDDWKAFGVHSSFDFDREVKLFRASLVKACNLAVDTDAVSRDDNPLFWSLRNAFITGDISGLMLELKHAFRSFLLRSRFPSSILATHQKIADLRYPHEWFPATRALQRTVHLHVGPTNSGKTYNALKALEKAKSGIYAGPLRLLAHEIYTRFTAKGIPCALVTGEEQRIPEGVETFFRSCTVEMTPLNHVVDVAVIDEIQMIGDTDRGGAWSQAFLGVQAKELHLCGEERTVELIESLCAMLGDKCVVTRYNRLNGLETMSKSLGGNLANLKKGDAVVSFSRIGIHALKKQIEAATDRRCAIIYGSLPPEIRAQQAAYFNDPDNDYDYLVASDAIGMGLNLEIRRVIFEATQKRDYKSFRRMSISEVKQIGGRAGRYRTANDAIKTAATAPVDGIDTPKPKPGNPGYVTALEDEDLKFLTKAFRAEAPPLRTAGIQPPTSAIERLSTYFPPNTPLSFILVRLREIARLSSKFHLCSLQEMLSIADLIQPFRMTIYDRCVFLNAPVALRDPGGAQILQAFARCVSTMEGGSLVDMREIPLEVLESDAASLPSLEALHKSITLYLWLSYRFSGVFTSQKLAFHVKEIVEKKIDYFLTSLNVSESARKKSVARQRKAAIEREQREEREKQEREKQEARDLPSSPESSNHEGVGEWNEPGHEEPLYNDISELQEINRLEPKHQD
ncbi:P-loop containing nucleoside triphosphate hydrolase protein [Astrocystis sublimbata]|nr:P-loop containing nucleoside triphosphate hydrolase protein [Astrocystis sublimbata]